MMVWGKKKKQEILQNFKKAKAGVFDFERIALLFAHSDHAEAHQTISDQTARDVDFEELFMFVDRTNSKIGQQLLYQTLRTIPKNQFRSLEIERIIGFLDANQKIKESTVLELNRLNDTATYFIQGLIFNKHIAKPSWFWLIPLFSVFSTANLILSIFYPVFILLFLPVLAINFVFHYWNKKNVVSYSNSIPQLLLLNRIAHKLIRSGVILERAQEVRKSNEAISDLSKAAIFFKIESKINNEMGQFGEFILELVKAAFLLEPILVFKVIRGLEMKRSDISILLQATAQVDVAISIASFREALPYYSFPVISNEKNSFFASEVYHPLINDAVANTMDLSYGKSVLISGSNMSGKTTFIRTIGINTILAQTINTVCARKFTTPVLKVHSAIKISDDLLDDTSYYFQEVKTMKKMIVASESASQNLFLLDEIFKGTNTIERIASGKAVLSYLSQNSNLVLVSTHHLELIDLLTDSYDYFHFSESVENGALTFDYKLMPGRLNNTNAIRILEINKFPTKITSEAKKLAEQIRKKKLGDKNE
jgi:DNA mismatch repair ATPase MutS